MQYKDILEMAYWSMVIDQNRIQLNIPTDQSLSQWGNINPKSVKWKNQHEMLQPLVFKKLSFAIKWRINFIICPYLPFFATNQFGAIFWKWERDEPLLTVCVIAGSPGKGAPLADVTQDRGQNRLGPIWKKSPNKKQLKKIPLKKRCDRRSGWKEALTL